MPIRADTVRRFASQMKNAAYVSKNGQGYILNQKAEPGEVVIPLAAPDNDEISSLDIGGRFLDLRDGLAPDKFTAEVRKVTPWPRTDAPSPNASIAWSTDENGPFQTVWTYDANLKWKDGQSIDRTLRWPEVDRHVTALPPGTRRVYVQYRIQGMALDDVRLATNSAIKSGPSTVRITHLWKQDGVEHNKTEPFDAARSPQAYSVDIPEAAQISNEALIVECLQSKQ